MGGENTAFLTARKGSKGKPRIYKKGRVCYES